MATKEFNVVSLDCETDMSRSGGFTYFNNRARKLYCCVAYYPIKQEFEVHTLKDHESLTHFLNNLPIMLHDNSLTLIGYNIKFFDLMVLSKYTTHALEQDILDNKRWRHLLHPHISDVSHMMGYGSLGHHAKTILNEPKQIDVKKHTPDSWAKLWNDDPDTIIKYCKHDCMLTYRLYKHAMEKKNNENK